jgi:hypothetical protein
MTSLFKIDSIMTNIDKASAALSEWAFNIVANVMPSYTIPTGSRLG